MLLQEKIMTKAELAHKIQKMINLETKSRSEGILEAIIGCLQDALVAGEEVSIKGFGSFKVVERAARQGRNPRSGEKINIPASKTIKFFPSKSLKDALN